MTVLLFFVYFFCFLQNIWQFMQMLRKSVNLIMEFEFTAIQSSLIFCGLREQPKIHKTVPMCRRSSRPVALWSGGAQTSVRLFPSVRQSLLAQVSRATFLATQYFHFNLLLVVTHFHCICSGLWSLPAPWMQVHHTLAISWSPSCPPPSWRSCLASGSLLDDLKICPPMFKVPSTCPIRERCIKQAFISFFFFYHS